MSSSLKDRINERMTAMGLKNADLARACKVKPPTSFNWGSGKTKSIKGEPLLRAAVALGVTPDWLATGKGKKFPDDDRDQYAVREPMAEYRISPIEYDEWIHAVIAIMNDLKPYQREGVLATVRTYVANLGSPRDGQALPVAEKRGNAR